MIVIKRYPIGLFASLVGVTTQTLRNWDKSGKLKPEFVSDTGYRYYSEAQLNALLGDTGVSQRKIVGYCRADESCLQEFKETMAQLYQGVALDIVVDDTFPIDLENSGLGSLFLDIIKFKVRVVVLSSSDSVSKDMRSVLDLLAKNFDVSVVIWR